MGGRAARALARRQGRGARRHDRLRRRARVRRRGGRHRLETRELNGRPRGADEHPREHELRDELRRPGRVRAGCRGRGGVAQAQGAFSRPPRRPCGRSGRTRAGAICGGGRRRDVDARPERPAHAAFVHAGLRDAGQQAGIAAELLFRIPKVLHCHQPPQLWAWLALPRPRPTTDEARLGGVALGRQRRGDQRRNQGAAVRAAPPLSKQIRQDACAEGERMRSAAHVGAGGRRGPVRRVCRR
mmetsp:Transcript_4317/g.12479  ORF Transcript_4317/g.12479 Transcript_4317/m.12479 type:complete len:242 (-) Transcript_4317:767-1492(-)